MNSTSKHFTIDPLTRQKAEKILEDRKLEMPVIDTEIEIKKLVHELQVHQIELEMQAEELKEANEIAETALKNYTLLFDFAQMGYFTVSAEGEIKDLNFTGAEILGDKRISLIGANFKLFFGEEELIKLNEFFERLFQGNEKESCYLNLGYKKSMLKRVYLEGIVTEKDTECLLSVIDISDIKM